jgi:hypothetical protein
MSTLLKVLGYIFAYMTVVGGGKTIMREGIHSYTLAALAIFGGITWVLFWGSKKLKERKASQYQQENMGNYQQINNYQNSQES